MKKEKQKGLVTTLIVCVLGLYASFLSWSILQERINTRPYGTNPDSGAPDYYKAPLVINAVQALLSSIVGFNYCYISSRANPFTVFTHNEPRDAANIFKFFVLVSITSSLASPIGYHSLKHIDYLAYLLAKSCKLIPVMLVHLVLYKTKFPGYKYLVAVLVTIGVTIFTLAQDSGKSSTKKGVNDGKVALGAGQLVCSMVLDGLTNSSQDQLFKLQSSKRVATTKVTGGSLMCILNALVFLFTLSYLVIVDHGTEIRYSINFANHYPQVWQNVLQFALCGSIGQIFVFIILEKFDSLVLITATVTRKMLSMILSVVLFGHSLNRLQWSGVALVFGGIGFEAYTNLLTKSNKSSLNKKIQ